MKCRLIFHNILHNRKKAVRAIISICFSVMLIFFSINAYISFQDMRLQNAYQTNGGASAPARIAMIAITMISSTSEKPSFCKNLFFIFSPLIEFKFPIHLYA